MLRVWQFDSIKTPLLCDLISTWLNRFTDIWWIIELFQLFLFDWRKCVRYQWKCMRDHKEDGRWDKSVLQPICGSSPTFGFGQNQFTNQSSEDWLTWNLISSHRSWGTAQHSFTFSFVFSFWNMTFLKLLETMLLFIVRYNLLVSGWMRDWMFPMIDFLILMQLLLSTFWMDLPCYLPNQTQEACQNAHWLNC